MHSALADLDKAIGMAERELELLDSEDVAGLEESAEARLQLLEAAWADKTDCDAVEFAEKLLRLRYLQGRLGEKADRLHAETREHLKARRQADRAISGYGPKIQRSFIPQVIAKKS